MRKQINRVTGPYFNLRSIHTHEKKGPINLEIAVPFGQLCAKLHNYVLKLNWWLYIVLLAFTLQEAL